MNWWKRASKLRGVVLRVLREHIELMQQDNDFHCGPATIQNLFRLMGKPVPDEHALAQELDTNPVKGTDPDRLEDWLLRHGFKVTRFPDGTRIEDHCDSNHVIVVEYQDYQEATPDRQVARNDSSHYAIIIGYDDVYYYLADTYYPLHADTSKKVNRIDKRRFLEDWKARSYDGKRLVRHYGLIVPI